MKKFLWPLATIVILSILLILFLPMIASTPIGKKIVLSAISQRMKGDLKVGSWELSWFGPQIIRNAHFKGDEIEYSSSEIQANLPFWSFLTITQFDERILKKLDGSVSLKNGQVILYDDDNSTVYIQNIDLNLYGDKGSDVNFELKGDSQVDQIIGSILIDGKISGTSNIFDSPNPTTLKIITVDFPTKSIDMFFQKLKKNSRSKFFQELKKEPDFFFSLLGPKVNANMLIEGKNDIGTIAAEISASSLKATLDGTLENKKLYLNQDLNITYELSDSFAKDLTENANPLFVTSIESLNPLILTIFKEGFQFPLDLNFKNIIIPKAILDVGKLKCENKKTLAIIIGIMKLQRLEKINEMIVWCTPLAFQIRNNILSSGRIDALIADSVHVCTYGDININNKKMNMVLGVPKDTLEKVLKIKNLPKEFVFQIPLKGTLDNPKINFKQTATKLAALIAAQATSKKIPELSELLNILGKFDEEITPPANQPFPWE